MQVGNDIVEVARFEKLVENNFLNKYFNDEEIVYVLSKAKKAETLAGLYSLKESVLKAFCIGIGNGLDLKDIQIIHTSLGKPTIKLTPKILELLKQQNCSQISCSISHTKEIASSICIIL